MSSGRKGEEKELMGVLETLSSSCKKEKYSLYLSLPIQSRIIHEPLSSCGVYSIGMARRTPFRSSLAHPLSSLNSEKSILLIPWNSVSQNRINHTCYLSCKGSSSSLFTLPSIPESVVECSECGIILSGRDCCKEKSHLKPFVSLPCHLKIHHTFTRLINNRVKTDITNEVLGGWESIHRVSNLSNYCSDSDFSESWNRKEDMVWVEGIHELIDFSFQLINLHLKLDNSLCSPFNLILEEVAHICLEEIEERSVWGGGRELEVGVKGKGLKEISIDFLTDNLFISWENHSEVFSETVYTSCFLIEENSSESCKGAEGELMGRDGRSTIGRESFEVSGNDFRIDFIGFREDEVSFSELRDTVRVNNSNSESFGSSTNEEVIEREMVVSSRFHTDYYVSFSCNKAGEGEGIRSKESEPFRVVRVFSGGGEFSTLLIHEACFKRSGTEIDTDEKVFSHDRTSLEIFLGYLVDPPFSDGNYPPGLRARSTSCNQISPSECGEPSSLSCSKHIENEGLPDTLTFYKYNSLKNKMHINIMGVNYIEL